VEGDRKYSLYPVQYVDGFSGIALCHAEEEVLVQVCQVTVQMGRNTYNSSGFVYPTRICIRKC
jgi:hypothetical protein